MLDSGLFQGLISQLDLRLRTCKSRTVGLCLLPTPDPFAQAMQNHSM